MERAVDISTELLIVLHLLFAVILGGLIGYDRESNGNNAGIRTYAAICMGATIFTSIASHIEKTIASPVIISTIITGVGFIGAGIIYQGRGKEGTQGLTSAATIWTTAAVGVSIALNMFIIAITSALTLYFLLSLQNYAWYRKWVNHIKPPAGGVEDEREQKNGKREGQLKEKKIKSIK